MAGGAFDTSSTPILAEHNPLITGLTQNLRTDPAELLKVAKEFAEKIIGIITDEVVAIIKAETGFDLSAYADGIPASLISLLDTPSLLLNGNFLSLSNWNLTGLGSLFGLDTSVLGALNGNSLTTIANGGLQQTIGQLIPTIPGQLVNLTGYTKYSGLTFSGTGSPIQMLVGLYDSAQNLLSTTTIDSIPGGTSGSSSGWMQLIGSPFTVPSGTSFVAPILQLTSAATGGNVWFSNVSLSKSGAIVRGLVPELQTMLDGIFHLGRGGSSTGNSALDAVESLLSLNDVAVGNTANLYPPYDIPYDIPLPPSELAQYLGFLTRLTAWGDFTAPGFDFNTGLKNTIATLLSQNLLAGLIDGKISADVLPLDLLNMLKQIINLGLPSATIPTSPADIITLAISAWNSWWAIITGTQQQATAAATQAASNTAAINQQITGGVSIVDTEFNTVATSNINSSYTTLYQGAGGGGLFADGIGNIVWLASGGIARTGFFLPPGALSTDNFDVQLLLDPNTAIPPPFNGSECYIWILARSNPALTEFTAVRIGYNSVCFGDAHAISGGAFIIRSVSFPIVSGFGDSFVLRGGYTASAWELKLLQNSKTVADFTDTGHNATFGPGFRCVGGGMTAADQDGSRSQLVPPKIASITASDRLASAA